MFLGLYSINFSNELRRTNKRIEFLIDANLKLEAEKEKTERMAMHKLSTNLQSSFNGSRRNVVVSAIGAVSSFVTYTAPLMRLGLMYSDKKKIEKEVSTCQSYFAMLKVLKQVSDQNKMAKKVEEVRPWWRLL